MEIWSLWKYDRYGNMIVMEIWSLWKYDRYGNAYDPNRSNFLNDNV